MSHHRETVTAVGAPDAVGPYTHAVKAGGLIFCSGQIPLDPATGQMVEGGFGAQAERMFAAVDAKGLPVAYLLFEGEQHGFRRSTTIRRALEAELYFYGRVFGFEPADSIEAVEIRNLPAPRDSRPLAP